MNLMKNILKENAASLIAGGRFWISTRPEYSDAMPNGFCIGGHSGRPERWRHDGSRWVAAEPSRYGFCVWGYDNDTPEVVRLGVNLSGCEVERLANLFLAVKEVAPQLSSSATAASGLLISRA